MLRMCLPPIILTISALFAIIKTTPVNAASVEEQFADLNSAASPAEKISAIYELGLQQENGQKIVDQLLLKSVGEAHALVQNAIVEALAKLNFSTNYVTKSKNFKTWFAFTLEKSNLEDAELYADSKAVSQLHLTLSLTALTNYWRTDAKQDVESGLKLLWLYENYSGYSAPKNLDKLLTNPLLRKIDTWFINLVDAEKDDAVKRLIKVKSLKRTTLVTEYVLTHLSEKKFLVDYLKKENSPALAVAELSKIYQSDLLNSDIAKILGLHCQEDAFLKKLFADSLATLTEEKRSLWATIIGSCQNKSWGKEFYQLLSQGDKPETHSQYAYSVTNLLKREYTLEVYLAALRFAKNFPKADINFVTSIVTLAGYSSLDISKEAQELLLFRLNNPNLSFDQVKGIVGALGVTGYFEGDTGKEHLIYFYSKAQSAQERVIYLVVGNQYQYSMPSIQVADLAAWTAADFTIIKSSEFHESFWAFLNSLSFNATERSSKDLQSFLNTMYVYAMDEKTELAKLNIDALKFLSKYRRINSKEIALITQRVNDSLKKELEFNYYEIGKWLSANTDSSERSSLYEKIKKTALEQDQKDLANEVKGNVSMILPPRLPDTKRTKEKNLSLESSIEFLTGLVAADDYLALDLFSSCVDPLKYWFGHACRSFSSYTPFANDKIAFYETVVKEHFQNPDRELRLWLGPVITLGVDEHPELREEIGALWIKYKKQYFTASDVSTLACGLADPTRDWFSDKYFQSPNSLGSEPMTLQGAATSLQLLYILQASSVCKDFKDLPGQLRNLFTGKDVVGSGSGLTQLAVKRVQQLVEATEFIIKRNRNLRFGSEANPGDTDWNAMPYSTFDQYALQFYVTIIQQLGIKPDTLAKPELYREALAIQTRMLTSLHGLSREGSFITTYAYATALINMNYESEDPLLHLHKIAKTITQNPTAVPYAPVFGQPTFNPRDAVGRAPIFYLALYQNRELLEQRDPGHGLPYQKDLVESLRLWEKFATDLILASFRDGYHLGSSHLGSHYFYPCLPYVALAIKALNDESETLSVADRAFLEQLKSRFKQILADVTQANGQAYPWGGVDGQPNSWTDGPAYASALLGMALVTASEF